ncbi:MAG: glutathione S-transferase family protein [Candidatus Binataceae bacterium]
MFELYHNNMSVCSQRVRIALDEKGIAASEHHLNLRAGDSQTPEYLKLNPNGVVPTLMDNGAAIVESMVINEYLDDVAPEPPLRPKDPAARARMRVWAKIPDEGLHGACGTISTAIAFRHQYLALPKEDLEKNIANTPDPSRRERKRQGIEYGLEAPFAPPAVIFHDRVLAKMDRQLRDTRWLACAEFSLADIALMPYIQRLEHLRQSWMWTEKRAAIARWFHRCRERTGYAGISRYLADEYLSLMTEKGLEAQPKIRAILNA